MASKHSSTFEYDTILFKDFPLQGEPVIHIAEMNDGNGFLLSGPKMDKLHESDTQHERGGIQCNRFDSLEDWLVKDQGCKKDEAGNIFRLSYHNGKKETIEEILEDLGAGSNNGSPMMVGGVMRITKITGSYRDPEKLFDLFFGSDDDEDDEDEED